MELSEIENLTARDLETLGEIHAASESFKRSAGDADGYWHEIYSGGWVKPMDFGGYDASHHSRTAKKLCRVGLVEVMDQSTRRSSGHSKYYRAGCRYRLTDQGRRALRTKDQANG